MLWTLCQYHAEMNNFLEQQWRTLGRDHLHGGWAFGQQCSCAFCLNGEVIRCVTAYLFMDSTIHTSAHQGFFGVSFLSTIETNTESLICTISGWSGTDRPGSAWTNYTELFPSWKRTMCIVLIGIDTYLGYEFAFPSHSTSVETTIHGL